MNGARTSNWGLGESSKLLQYLPSPQSTDKETKTKLVDYSIAHDNDETTTLMPTRVPSDSHLELEEPPPYPHGFIRRILSRKCGARGKCAAVIATLVIVVFVTFSHKKETPGGLPDLPLSSPSKPFSTLDPVKDLGLYPFDRPHESSPQATCLGKHATSILSTNSASALPTNAWYENVLLSPDEPTTSQRAYTVPHVVDMVGPIPGLRMHPNHIDTSQTVMQLSLVASHGLTLGVAGNANEFIGTEPQVSKRYSVTKTTPLGFSLAWGENDTDFATCSIVRGMPYATMHYPTSIFKKRESLFPTIVSEITMHQKPLVDGNALLDCNDGDDPQRVLVKRELELTFYDSDFTWLVFFSQPVWLQCRQHESASVQQVGVPPSEGSAAVVLQVIDLAEDDASSQGGLPLTVRMALVSNCTSGHNPIYCRSGPDPSARKEYATLLREHAHLYPGPDTDIEYTVDNDKDEATLSFHWDVRDMTDGLVDDDGSVEPDSRRLGQVTEGQETTKQLIMFALPHHMQQFEKQEASGTPLGPQHCQPSLRGASCLVGGSSWKLPQSLPPVGFRAPRSPLPGAMQPLAEALQQDISYTLPTYYQQGVGDTYFSGKMLAKLARILIIADEMMELCPSSHRHKFNAACSNLTLPTELDFSEALDRLRSGVEIWINGTGEVPFVYDTAWGGLVNCGCDFDPDSETCKNRFPNCPGFSNPGLNFGNGFYNDHHFHYGYHIYGAAVVSLFDPDWGQRFFERVLLLVRDIANPSVDDRFFPQFRQKDWYFGNSWASGISSATYPNGKNQESSSEAIAAYEAVSLYGSVMSSVWNSNNMPEKMSVSNHVRGVGRILAATEIRAADWYWHVRQKDESMRVYPREYKENVVGVMWSTMAQFQTWFGSAPYLPYGIQLLPLTSVSEHRDDEKWVREAYVPFAEGCESREACRNDGWSVLQYALLATVGHRELAMENAQSLSPDVFESAGGNGHSLSNTLWYISTRPDTDSLPLSTSETSNTEPKKEKVEKHELVDCGCPKTCTDDVLDLVAQGYTCRDRIIFVINSWGYSEEKACATVGGMDYPHICGPCNPNSCKEAIEDNDRTTCPPCSEKVCRDPTLSRCPVYDTTYLCTEGPSRGGCSPDPWYDAGQCRECCTTNSCSEFLTGEDKENTKSKVVYHEDEKNCPPCSDEVCQGKMALLCPVQQSPFLCTQGSSVGGCSPLPWEINARVCGECCTLSACSEKEKSLVKNKQDAKHCPPCSRDVCRGDLNRCPADQSPFLCTEGAGKGGCSPEPWDVVSGICEECCFVAPDCGND